MKSRSATRAGIWILASVVGVPLAALAQVTVSDTTFANADGTLNVFPGGNGGSVTAIQVTAGSNFLRSISDTVNGTPSIILGTHIYTPFTYTPSASMKVASA